MKATSYYIGKIYGNWTIVRAAPSRDGTNKRYTWIIPFVLCRCVCGYECEVNLRNVIRLHSRNCIYCRARRAAEVHLKFELEPVYGKWRVLYKFKEDKRDIKSGKRGYLTCKCECGCGKKQYVRCSELRRGKSKSCIKCSYEVLAQKKLGMPRVNLSNRQVLHIKELIMCNIKNIDIAKITGATRDMISLIKRNKTWKNIPWPNINIYDPDL